MGIGFWVLGVSAKVMGRLVGRPVKIIAWRSDTL